MPHCFIEVSFE